MKFVSLSLSLSLFSHSHVRLNAFPFRRCIAPKITARRKKAQAYQARSGTISGQRNGGKKSFNGIIKSIGLPPNVKTATENNTIDGAQHDEYEWQDRGRTRCSEYLCQSRKEVTFSIVNEEWQPSFKTKVCTLSLLENSE